MSLFTESRKNERLAGFDTCTGCGTCYAMCPSDAIELRVDARRGVYYPEIDSHKCSDCGVCSRVCPGISLDIESVARSMLQSKSRSAVIGCFEECYVAHSTDRDIRYSSSSGGLVTSLLILALEEGLIDGALVTRMSESDPLLPQPFIARTREDIMSASRSKYCPVPANVAVRMLRESEGRFAVVGLPCHLHGMRMAEMVSETLRRKVVLHLGLFCSHTLSFHATSHLLAKLGVSSDEVAGIDYRGRGWPGGITIRRKDGRDHFVSNSDPLWGAIFGNHFFTPSSCLRCKDLTSELSDLSFGDPWLPEVTNAERIGRSIVLSRSREGENLLKIARDRGAIEADIVDSRKVIASQATYLYFKKGNIKLRQRLVGPSHFLSREDVNTKGGLVDGLIALTVILNSSMGCNRLTRGILVRIPGLLSKWYFLAFSTAIARARNRWVR